MGRNLKTKEPYKVVESSSSKDNFIVLLYKYDPSKPTKNFDPNSMELGRNPEAGNIFVTGKVTCLGNPKKCSCGVLNNENLRIIGGEVAPEYVYPWMVQLEMIFKDNKTDRCGGTLITDRFKY